MWAVPLGEVSKGYSNDPVALHETAVALHETAVAAVIPKNMQLSMSRELETLAVLSSSGLTVALPTNDPGRHIQKF